MRYAGIDIAAETHVVAVLDEDRQVRVRPTPFAEDDGGYAKLVHLLGSPAEALIAMEASGPYWQNLFARLAAEGYAVAVLNPLRSRRFAAEDLQRTKTDAIDALGLARFAAEKRPPTTRLTDPATQELRELVRFRDRVRQDFGDRTRQLHRLVQLGFPEFRRHIKTLDSQLATAVLHAYPTARAFDGVSVRKLAGLVYDGRHRLGSELARQLIETARVSVGAHHGPAYQIQVRFLCEEMEVLRRQLQQLEGDIHRLLEQHTPGRLLTSIDGIGPDTAARLVAELGDPAQFRSPQALAAYVGLVPATRHSGKRQPLRAGLTPIGHARLRAALWMPTLTAVRRNPWLRAFYQRLRSRGKLPKVALVAAMRKLLHAVYWVAKHRRPFIPHPAAVTT